MKHLLFFIFVTSFAISVDAQIDSFVVKDKKLDSTLREYLLAHHTVYTKDSLGKRIEFTRDELKEMYNEHFIVSKNLRFDSSFSDKSIVGIYRFSFASLSEPPWLYIQNKNSIEFISLDPKKFQPEKILRRFQKFCKKNPTITKQEKVRMLKEAFEVIYSNMYESFGCY